jgi:hypothetical protein
MPGFDGTGPQNQGPMTGRGKGYCAIKVPKPGEVPQGYVGWQGTPWGLGARFAGWLGPARSLAGAFRRSRGRGTGRGRGRRSGRW